MENNIAHIAADTNVIVNLSLLHQYGQDILKELEENGFDTGAVQNMVQNNKYLAKNFYYERSFNGDICSQLRDTARLYIGIKNGSIQVYVLPTVAGELGLEEEGNIISQKILSFFQEIENITVLTIPNEMKYRFYYDSMKLAKEYVKYHTMQTVYSPVARARVPSTDAFIMAESSLFGLFLATFNEKDFIHESLYDFKRSDNIEISNKNQQLWFMSNMEKRMVSRPISVYKFLERQKNQKLNPDRTFFTYPNIDERTGQLIPATISE